MYHHIQLDWGFAKPTEDFPIVECGDFYRQWLVIRYLWIIIVNDLFIIECYILITKSTTWKYETVYSAYVYRDVNTRSQAHRMKTAAARPKRHRRCSAFGGGEQHCLERICGGKVSRHRNKYEFVNLNFDPSNYLNRQVIAPSPSVALKWRYVIIALPVRVYRYLCDFPLYCNVHDTLSHDCLCRTAMCCTLQLLYL